MIDIQANGINDSRVSIPGSKSYTHRALVAAALSNGYCRIGNPLDSEDTRLTAEALRCLGVAIQPFESGLVVHGRGGRFATWDPPVELNNSGTSMRLLTALASVGTGRYVLTGSDRMRQRPLGDLVNALIQVGVDVESVHGNGCPPVAVMGGTLTGGQVWVDCHISSQYLSALLFVAPLAPLGMDIRVRTDPVSTPYIDMTLAVMERFGIRVDRDGYRRFRIAGRQRYRAADLAIEPDASNAGYFWAAAAITGRTVKVAGLDTDSRQGDIGFVEVLARMGCTVTRDPDGIAVTGGKLTGLDVDMSRMPDLVPTLAVVAAFARGRTTIRNVAHLKAKESDRLSAVTTELRKMGIEAESDDDSLTVVGGRAHGAVVDTYDDHRIAMSFAVAGIKVPGVKIRNEGCVTKSFPGFWKVFGGLYRK
ncbi:MAG: 3-phosphoshikimate 1-carboxyvinyltransferase [Deltaproteobacteria bacterium]|nr:MAG: 3-phosphoshikimate 1-carboxyvinyltransferase [Deltaproteobacteria bacterium]